MAEVSELAHRHEHSSPNDGLAPRSHGHGATKWGKVDICAEYLTDTACTSTRHPSPSPSHSLELDIYIVVSSISEPWFFIRSRATHLNTLCKICRRSPSKHLTAIFPILLYTPGLWRGFRTHIEDFFSLTWAKILYLDLRRFMSDIRARCQDAAAALAQGQWPFAIKIPIKKSQALKLFLN